MLAKSQDTETHVSEISPSEINVVNVPRVEYEKRSVTDKWWALLYLLSYLAFVACGCALASRAKNKYVTNESGMRLISDHYVEDARKCCDETGGSGSVCYHLEGYDNNAQNRRRFLEATSRKLDGDEGIFDAFLEAPEIPVTLFLLSLAVSVLWIVLLRFFSRTMVAVAEVGKIALSLFLAIYFKAYIFCFFAGLSLLYVIFARSKFLFAAKILSHSALGEKPDE